MQILYGCLTVLDYLDVALNLGSLNLRWNFVFHIWQFWVSSEESIFNVNQFLRWRSKF